MKGLLLWSSLALASLVPVGLGVVRNAGCGACDCCGCCEAGICTCKDCGCACCSDDGCPGQAAVADEPSASGCCKRK